jgi:hypothetical protein
MGHFSIKGEKKAMRKEIAERDSRKEIGEEKMGEKR